MSELRNRFERREREGVVTPTEDPCQQRTYTKQAAEDSQIRPLGAGASPRARMNRQITGVVTEDDTVSLWNKSVEEERLKHERIGEQARADRERRQAEAAARVEDQRKAAEVKKRRDAWYDEQRAEADVRVRADQSRAVEDQLIMGQIKDVCDGMSATVLEKVEVSRRLQAQGLFLVPSMWAYTLNEIRNGN